MVQSLPHKTEGVQVLHLDPGAKGLVACPPDAHVGITPEAALLHVPVADIEGHHQPVKGLEVV
jgi:hypothetical protein